MNNELIKITKLELHMHLDGSVAFSLLEKWSGRPYDEVFNEVVSQNDVSLEDYLDHFNFINQYLALLIFDAVFYGLFLRCRPALIYCLYSLQDFPGL